MRLDHRIGKVRLSRTEEAVGAACGPGGCVVALGFHCGCGERCDCIKRSL